MHNTDKKPQRDRADTASLQKEQLGFEYILRRSRRRTVSVQVDTCGAVTVSAPLRLPQSDIMRFLQDRQYWVSKKRAQALQRIERFLPLFEFGYVMLCGSVRAVVFAQQKEAVAMMHDGEVLIPLRKGEDKCAAVKRYMKSAGAAVIARARQFALNMGFSDDIEFSLCDSRRCWGTCNSKNGIKLNFRLAMLPQTLCDYVITHELCHTVHLDHSSAFWNMLTGIMPGARGHSRELKEYAALFNLYRC